MSEEFKKMDIETLTKDAEHGHGCALSAAITNLGIEERFKVLQSIASTNAKHRADDPSLPELAAYSNSSHWRYSSNNIYSTLSVNGGLFAFDQRLYKDVLNANMALTDTCNELNLPKKQ